MYLCLLISQITYCRAERRSENVVGSIDLPKSGSAAVAAPPAPTGLRTA